MLTPGQLTGLRGMADLYRNSAYEHIEIHKSWLIGAAYHIDAQQGRMAELEQDAARYRWLRDNVELPMVIIGSRWYGTQHAGCLDLNEFVDSEMQK